MWSGAHPQSSAELARPPAAVMPPPLLAPQPVLAIAAPTAAVDPPHAVVHWRLTPVVEVLSTMVPRCQIDKARNRAGSTGEAGKLPPATGQNFNGSNHVTSTQEDNGISATQWEGMLSFVLAFVSKTSWPFVQICSKHCVLTTWLAAVLCNLWNSEPTMVNVI